MIRISNILSCEVKLFQLSNYEIAEAIEICKFAKT
jgi:hypothetical protein